MAVRDCLPQRHGEQHVPGEGRLVRGREGRLVKQVELGLALVAPRAQRLQVAQGLLGHEGLAEPTGRGWCRGAGHGGDHGVRP